MAAVCQIQHSASVLEKIDGAIANADRDMSVSPREMSAGKKKPFVRHLDLSGASELTADAMSVSSTPIQKKASDSSTALSVSSEPVKLVSDSSLELSRKFEDKLFALWKKELALERSEPIVIADPWFPEARQIRHYSDI
uniref:Uncharacterized protein n=1 Tax=Erythrolobus madagascarensis TaxID=708628 RepID=A0A7S0XIL6_9RHOD|mmetsp:Transcript_40/g.72  ORF Transcript_40/g.72 Transcript_40/m.72 type:complete len:139 (+) Transcript_40:49-465(+)